MPKTTKDCKVIILYRNNRVARVYTCLHAKSSLIIERMLISSHVDVHPDLYRVELHDTFIVGDITIKN